MENELLDLLDVALDREIVAQSYYLAGQKKTSDQAAIRLMHELAEAEEKHYTWILELKSKGANLKVKSPGAVRDLMISQSLVNTGIPDKASLQDVIVAAMKREEKSVGFYAQMKGVLETGPGQTLCDRLILEEKHHKAELEKFYDDVFNKEN